MLSIVVPSRLRRAPLRTLESLKGQDIGAERFEVVVAADGAEPEAVAAVRDASWPYPLRVVERPHGGIAAARNSGAKVAEHPWLVFLDDDMDFGPTFLRALAKPLEDGADVAQARIRIGDWVPDTPYARAVRRWEQRQDLRPERLHLSAFAFAAAAVRGSLFWSVGGFDEDFSRPGRYGSVEKDMGHRLTAAGARVELVADALVHTDLVTDRVTLLERARMIGRNDVLLVSKHPDLAERVFTDQHLGRSRGHRVVAAMVARAPMTASLARPLQGVLGVAARLGWGGRLADSIWKVARGLRYWQGVVEAGGRAHTAIRRNSSLRSTSSS